MRNKKHRCKETLDSFWKKKKKEKEKETLGKDTIKTELWG